MTLATIFSALLAAHTTAASGAASVPRVTMAGFGPVRIGMTVPELERALGRKMDPAKDEDEIACRYVSLEDVFEGVSLMLVRGQLARVDVDSATTRTLSSVRVGDSQTSVLSLYGQKLDISPHKYAWPEGSYLTMYSRNKQLGIRFETDGHVVSRYYAGTAAAIQYVEGCQ